MRMCVCGVIVRAKEANNRRLQLIRALDVELQLTLESKQDKATSRSPADAWGSHRYILLLAFFSPVVLKWKRSGGGRDGTLEEVAFGGRISCLRFPLPIVTVLPLLVLCILFE